jgi:ATP citrate (pro-S)-lyase
MINLKKLRKRAPKIIVVGNHRPIIQSMLDFDYLSGKSRPSISAVIASGRKQGRYFFGSKEILIPIFASAQLVPAGLKDQVNLFLNLASARRVRRLTDELFAFFPKLEGGVIFAENVPERHALALDKLCREREKFIIGPASVGLLIPHHLKLGAIGGVETAQLAGGNVFTPGRVAALSASGGMTNELINILAQNHIPLSFALSFGGDRFPVTTPVEALLAAEADPETETILYFGELGGSDEYAIVALLEEGKLTKPILCHIAGTIAEMFAEPPQFGHAKAMAKKGEEAAAAKRKALKEAGAAVSDSFSEFIDLIKKLPVAKPGEKEVQLTKKMAKLHSRKPALFTSTISSQAPDGAKVLGDDILNLAKEHSFAFITASLLLGRKIKSKELEEFVDLVLKLLVDHGPHVSGAVNTIIASRAGKDLVSSLSSGLLTIGPRFGGAINQAAANWFKGVTSKVKPFDFVEDFAQKNVYIAGIGHRLYRIDQPDPRVAAISGFAQKLSRPRFLTFAREVEQITAAKKGNLILNVDGAVAAVLLDLLSEKEGLSDSELRELIEIEFFNAFFVLSRAVGFTAHFLDQKRLDEGLFRLRKDEVAAVAT